MIKDGKYKSFFYLKGFQVRINSFDEHDLEDLQINLNKKVYCKCNKECCAVVEMRRRKVISSWATTSQFAIYCK